MPLQKVQPGKGVGRADLAIEYRPLASLIPYARNARTHSEAQIAQIAASIVEFGWTNPILVDGENGIIAGHGRVLAARQLGIDPVPCIELAGLSEAQRRAYVLADNKLALNAGWDEALLRVELADLRGMAFDLSLIGFGADEQAAILNKAEGLTDPDDAPAAPEHPVSRMGDLWLLGRHRLLCGDSTVATDVERLMNGREVDICFTSPPYAQQRDYKTGPQDWDALMRRVFSILPAKQDLQLLVNLGLVHINGEWLPYWDGWIDWMRAEGWRRFAWYVWDQGPGLPGDWNGRLAPAHEFVFHFNRIAKQARKTKDKLPESIAWGHGGALREKDGRIPKLNSPHLQLQPRKIPDSVIRVMRQKARGIERAHPAVFPVALSSEMLTAFSDAGDAAFEPFSGSGTTIISAEMTSRIAYALEIAPAYVDVAVKRWQDFTGKQATLDGDGRTFDEVASERAKANAKPPKADHRKSRAPAGKGRARAKSHRTTATA